MTTSDRDRLTIAMQARAIWERNAVFWDDHMGEGNGFHLQLIRPAVEGLLAPRPGEAVLDLACGNGLYARHLTDQGCAVVACDFSASFIARAREREVGVERKHPIDYQVIDVADPAQLATLGSGRFDAIVCNMAIMDIVDVNPLFEAVPRLLTPGGRFVFTVAHPCFNTIEAVKTAELDEQVDPPRMRHGIHITGYLDIPPRKGIGIAGQPEMHFYFHRTLSEMLNLAFDHGMVMDGIMEPAFPDRDGNDNRISWTNLPGIPPVLAARLRVAARHLGGGR
jgi:SAM-dependent methyltransferase